MTKMAVSVRCTSNAKEYTAPFSHENPLTQTSKSKIVKQSIVGLFIYSSFLSWPPVMYYHVISMHSNHQGWHTCIAKGLEASGEAKKSRVLGGLNSLIFCLVIEPFACGQLPCSWQCLKGTWLEEVKVSSKSQQCNECGSPRQYLYQYSAIQTCNLWLMDAGFRIQHHLRNDGSTEIIYTSRSATLNLHGCPNGKCG